MQVNVVDAFGHPGILFDRLESGYLCFGECGRSELGDLHDTESSAIRCGRGQILHKSISRVSRVKLKYACSLPINISFMNYWAATRSCEFIVSLIEWAQGMQSPLKVLRKQVVSVGVVDEKAWVVVRL